jgi:hypothetical protein
MERIIKTVSLFNDSSRDGLTRYYRDLTKGMVSGTKLVPIQYTICDNTDPVVLKIY